MTGPAWFDSHCHIQDAYRPDDAEVLDVLASARESGVGGLVCVGTDAASSRQAVSLARRYGSQEIGGASGAGGAGGAFSVQDATTVGVWATVGLHPHEAKQGVEEITSLLGELSGPGSAVVAVGECGLDYHYDHSPRSDQRRAFAAQVALARQHQLTLVVHSRAAWDDTLDVLTEADGHRVVLHCFSGGPAEARRCLDLGATLSFSGIVTFPNAQDVRDAVALCPVDRLLVETDAPFLAPVPHRGRPNQPAWVSVVGTAVAAVKGVPAEELAGLTTANARRVFGLD